MPSDPTVLPSTKLSARLLAYWTFPLSFIAADFILAAVVVTLAGAYWLDRAFSPTSLALMAGIIVAGQILGFTYRKRTPDRSWLIIGRIVLGGVAAVSIYWLIRGSLSGVTSRATFGSIVVAFVLIQAALHWIHRRKGGVVAFPGVELFRWMAVVAAAMWLHHPLLTAGSVGAGDAYWYNIMTADFISQWRAGIFPVFAGQTEFAFNGAISPLRFAPALQHLAGVIDIFTLRSLSFTGILNLTLAASLIGGALTCYGCLRAIEPRGAWIALLLALLYSACPGVLALAYAGDLYMSVTAVPWVPVLLYGCWRTMNSGDLRGVLIMVAGAAALWYCHPPIALWGTIIAALTQLIRLARDGRSKRTWLHWLLGAGLFGSLTAYEFVSVKLTGIPAIPPSRPVMIGHLTDAYPAALKPVSDGLNSLGDYQLGWALWSVLVLGLGGLIAVRPRLPALGFACAFALFLALLLPIPWLLEKVWMNMPQFICDMTFMWPMQRFYLLLAGLTVFLCFAGLGMIISRRPIVQVLFLVLFSLAGIWSFTEAQKFHRQTTLRTSPAAQVQKQILPQNRILTRYAFNPFPTRPPYISHGFIDPLMVNRLLAFENLAELTSNGERLENDQNLSVVRSSGDLMVNQPNMSQPHLASASPFIILQPRKRYALTFDFAYPESVGALILEGARLARHYWLPDSAFDTKPIAPSRAFAAIPGRSHTVTLWTDGDAPEAIRWSFFFSTEGPSTPVTTFGRYILREFDPEKLPVRVDRWAPLEARVASPAPAYFETPRMYLDGYRAVVDGVAAEVERSPHGLVMVRVPAGESRVSVYYFGQWLLRAAYFFTFAAWLGLIVAWIRSAPGKRDAARSAAA